MGIASPEPSLSDAMRSAAAAWFGAAPLEVAALSGAGFSGASLARLRPVGVSDWFVLKAFGAGTERARVAWVHGLVRHVAAAGVADMPSPCATLDGQTVVTDTAGVHWELVPFVAGLPTDVASGTQAAAALAALARVHAAAATLPHVTARIATPPAVVRRRAHAAALAAHPWSRRQHDAAARAADETACEIAGRWRRAVAVFESAGGGHAVSAIARAAAPQTPLQPVLRDVWSAHVLFAAGAPPRVAGLVDPHGAAVDTPATDIARLLGSWRRVGDPPQADLVVAWPEAIASYAAVRSLPSAELALVPFLHAAGVVCGLDNWFRWTLEEGRTFAVPAATLARIDRLLDDLPAALEWLAGSTCRRRLTRGNCSL